MKSSYLVLWAGLGLIGVSAHAQESGAVRQVLVSNGSIEPISGFVSLVSSDRQRNYSIQFNVHSAAVGVFEMMGILPGLYTVQVLPFDPDGQPTTCSGSDAPIEINGRAIDQDIRIKVIDHPSRANRIRCEFKIGEQRQPIRRMTR